MIPRGAFLLLALIASATAAARQASAPAPAPAPPRPVQITAVVQQPDGRPVAGLRAADFVLTVDGARRAIDEATPRTAAPRVVAILLDEFHVRPDQTDRVREAVHRLVEQQLRPDDRIAVLKPLDSLPGIVFTSNRDRLHDAIASFDGRQGNYTPRSALEAETMGRSPAFAEISRAQIVLSGLRALAAKVGGQHGRAAILIVSNGFVPDTHLAESRALPDAGIVERFANRYDVPVYAVAPEAAADDDPSPRAVLTRLAAQTGGFFAQTDDPAAALERAVSELDRGYLLTFTPAAAPDGRFHTIHVDSTKRGATVRTQAGYISPPSFEMRHAARDLPDPLLTTRMQHVSPLIDVWSGITRVGDGGANIVVTWEPGRSLGRTTVSPATRVSVLATQPNGTVLYQGVLMPVRTQALTGSDVTNRAEFRAPPGRVYLDMTIFGPRGEKLDVDARDLDVPAGGSVVEILPPVIVAARSALEFREALANLAAPPDPGHDFSRTTQLLVRVPVAGGDHPRVTAQLLNRKGEVIRQLDVLPGGPDNVTQFDLPLAPYAPGDYMLLLTASSQKGSPVQQRVSFRITG